MEEHVNDFAQLAEGDWVEEDAERKVRLTLSSGLVAWGDSWSTSLEDAWHENVVPLLLLEWVLTKLIQRSDCQYSEQTSL